MALTAEEQAWIDRRLAEGLSEEVIGKALKVRRQKQAGGAAPATPATRYTQPGPREYNPTREPLPLPPPPTIEGALGEAAGDLGEAAKGWGRQALAVPMSIWNLSGHLVNLPGEAWRNPTATARQLVRGVPGLEAIEEGVQARLADAWSGSGRQVRETFARQRAQDAAAAPSAGEVGPPLAAGVATALSGGLVAPLEGAGVPSALARVIPRYAVAGAMPYVASAAEGRPFSESLRAGAQGLSMMAIAESPFMAATPARRTIASLTSPRSEIGRSLEAINRAEQHGLPLNPRIYGSRMWKIAQAQGAEPVIKVPEGPAMSEGGAPVWPSSTTDVRGRARGLYGQQTTAHAAERSIAGTAEQMRREASEAVGREAAAVPPTVVDEAATRAMIARIDAELVGEKLANVEQYAPARSLLERTRAGLEASLQAPRTGGPGRAELAAQYPPGGHFVEESVVEPRLETPPDLRFVSPPRPEAGPFQVPTVPPPSEATAATLFPTSPAPASMPGIAMPLPAFGKPLAGPPSPFEGMDLPAQQLTFQGPTSPPTPTPRFAQEGWQPGTPFVAPDRIVPPQAGPRFTPPEPPLAPAPTTTLPSFPRPSPIGTAGPSATNPFIEPGLAAGVEARPGAVEIPGIATPPALQPPPVPQLVQAEVVRSRLVPHPPMPGGPTGPETWRAIQRLQDYADLEAAPGQRRIGELARDLEVHLPSPFRDIRAGYHEAIAPLNILGDRLAGIQDPTHGAFMRATRERTISNRLQAEDAISQAQLNEARTAVPAVAKPIDIVQGLVARNRLAFYPYGGTGGGLNIGATNNSLWARLPLPRQLLNPIGAYGVLPAAKAVVGASRGLVSPFMLGAASQAAQRQQEQLRARLGGR